MVDDFGTKMPLKSWEESIASRCSGRTRAPLNAGVRRTGKTMPKVPVSVSMADSAYEADVANGEMRRYADRVEATLRRFHALPSRKTQLSIIGDLAALNFHGKLMQRALRDFVATKPAKAAERTFEDRLLELTGQIEMVRMALKSVRRPIRRLVEKRCDVDGIVAADMRGLATSVKGFVPKK